MEQNSVFGSNWLKIWALNERKFKKSSYGKRILQFSTDINAPLRLEHQILALTLARECLVVSEN